MYERIRRELERRKKSDADRLREEEKAAATALRTSRRFEKKKILAEDSKRNAPEPDDDTCMVQGKNSKAACRSFVLKQKDGSIMCACRAGQGGCGTVSVKEAKVCKAKQPPVGFE